jgi:dihydroxyacetone kinase
MTSLDMAGVSLTLLALTPDMEPLLAADTAAPGWPRTSGSTTTTHSSRQQPVPLPTGLSDEADAAVAGQQAGASSSSGQAVLTAGCVRAAAEALQQAVPLLNEMDAKVRSYC